MNTFQNHASFTQPAAVRIDEWYVYQDSGMHTGPLTLEALVRSLAFSNIPRTAFGGYAGEGRWRQFTDIPEVAAALQAFEAASQAAPPPSVRSSSAALASRVPSSKSPPAPPLGFVSPPRVPAAPVASVASVAPAGTQVMAPAQAPLPQETSPDETIPAPSNAPLSVVDAAPKSSAVSSEAATARAPAGAVFRASPIPPSLPPAVPVPMPFIPPSPMPQMMPHPQMLPQPHPQMQMQPQPQPQPIAPTMPVAVVTDHVLAAALAAEKKGEKPEKKDVLDPRFRFLPFAIFGGCVFIAAVEVVVGLVIG